MAQIAYCWRCKTEVAMMNETEWAQVSPLLTNVIQQIKDDRQQHGVSLAEARRDGFGGEAMAKYFELTGTQAAHPDVLWHHRRSLFGPLCSQCGKPRRTPRANFCAACGAEADKEPA